MSSNEDPEITKRVTRSSKSTTKDTENLQSPPRKKKTVPANAKKNSSNKEPTKSPGKKAKRGRPAKSRKVPQNEDSDSDPLDTLSLDKLASKSGKSRGRGIGRSRGRGRGRGGIGRGKKPGKSFHWWGRSPPTAQQLAEMGAKDGCTYALTTKGRFGARNRGYMAGSRSLRAAEIAVANLYDSD